MAAASLDIGGYTTFAHEVRGGGFVAPESADSWPAELVAAHITLNNDAFTETVRRVLSGSATSDDLMTSGYDNANAVDDETLRSFVAEKDLDAIAAEVERSAADLASAYTDLVGTDPDVTVHVKITHAGHVIVDEPRSLATMVEGNASFHLEMHREQLLALRPDSGRS